MRTKKLKRFVDKSDRLVRAACAASQEIREKQNYEFAICNLEILVLKHMKRDCQTFLTGLHQIGVCANTAESIHLLLVIGNSYCQDSSIERSAGQIMLLKEFIDRDENWFLVRVYTGAPAINCIFNPTGQRFMITIGNGFKYEMSKTIRHLFRIQREASKLYHFLRMYLADISRSRFKYFQIIVLLVFYLQRHRFLPPLIDVQEGIDAIVIDGTQMQSDDSRDWSNYHGLGKIKDYRDHIYPFFKFYKGFNFIGRIINIHQGIDVPIKDYPLHFAERSAMNSVLLNLEQNASSSVQIEDIDLFVDICEQSCKRFRRF